MKERYICLIIFCALHLVVIRGQEYSGQFHDVSKIIISKIDWNAATDVSISCANFERQRYPCYISTDKRRIRKICKIISSLRKRSGYIVSDYRCKIYLFKEDTLATSICIGKNNVLVDGFYFETSERLLKEVDKVRARFYNFLYDNYLTEEYPGGQKALYGFLKRELENYLLPPIHLNLFISVSIDREGNTISVKYKNSNSSSIPDSWFSALNDVFYNKIRWSRDYLRPEIYRVSLRFKLYKNP